MKKSSKYISESVFNVNAHYTKLQNKTKILYFRCLKENKSTEYFAKEVRKIWHNVDHRFMDKHIDKIKEIIKDSDIELALNKGRLSDKYKLEGSWEIDDEFFKIVPESQFREFERKFETDVIKNYDRTRKTLDERIVNKDKYIDKRVDTYTEQVNQIVAYFNAQGDVIRHVQLSTYLSMIHNTNLTRAAWNQAMFDADKLDANMFIIPYHNFSCIDCYRYQNRPLTRDEVENIIGVPAVEQEGDIIHPNCKCTLSIYWDESQIQKEKFTEEQVKDMYGIRQKINSLTLERERIKTDMKIEKNLGSMEKFDDFNKRRNEINRRIRELKSSLPFPTREFKIQAEAINR